MPRGRPRLGCTEEFRTTTRPEVAEQIRYLSRSTGVSTAYILREALDGYLSGLGLLHIPQENTVTTQKRRDA
ncbi:ribbon-helix-helix domain-containing protein [Streptomyces xinghaiensis]|uniref:ribbon-helix-helix domain-containing protein n=1 Tax=Streptomyces xinghaiensis TaxID=1038928 RepID=UPI0037BB0D7C